MRKYVKPNLKITDLPAIDILCASGILPEIDNNAPGKENDTPAVPIL